jgi:hypothetical protein
MEYNKGKLHVSAKNMTILVQNQTRKKFGPFLIVLPKIRPQNFLAPHNFFRSLLCFAAHNEFEKKQKQPTYCRPRPYPMEVKQATERSKQCCQVALIVAKELTRENYAKFSLTG